MSNQGWDPNNPNPWGAQQQPQQPAAAAPAPQPGGDALGFQSAPKDEKYNTMYLASNLTKQNRTPKIIMVAVLGVLALGLGIFFITSGGGEHKKPGAPGAEAEAAHGAPAHGAPAHAAAEAPKPAEAAPPAPAEEAPAAK
jgi:hypothetical protein